VQQQKKEIGGSRATAGRTGHINTKQLTSFDKKPSSTWTRDLIALCTKYGTPGSKITWRASNHDVVEHLCFCRNRQGHNIPKKKRKIPKAVILY
jgi:hypothetical protein